MRVVMALFFAARRLHFAACLAALMLIFIAAIPAETTTHSATTIQPGEAFPGINRARIDAGAGFPRLMLNDQPVLPIIFWFTPGKVRNYQTLFQDPQVKMAAQAGIHIYGLIIDFPRAADGLSTDFVAAEKILDSFIQVDPQATFFIRVFPFVNPQWKSWPTIPRDEMMVFDDGTTASPYISIASETFARSFREETTRIVRHFETGPYAKRIVGYHLGGPEFEMFPPHYTEKGPDLCPASQRLFRIWLRQKYSTDQALAAAWGDAHVTLATAAIPRPEKGRFPMKGTGDGSLIRVFYNTPAEQAWVDYSDYYSDLVAERVTDWARTVKTASAGHRLSMFCQGYLFDIGGSYSGHYALAKVLACPEIDILMSPLSYFQRLVGQPAGIMSPVDSVIAHGKLWLNEDDMRTCFIDLNHVPREWFGAQPFDTFTKDLHETENMLERNLGMTMVHRAGIWWCDLVGGGAFNHPALWRMLRARKQIYQRSYDHPKPYRPEVAVIADERSRLVIRSDWDMSSWSLGQLRIQCDTSGASVGYYLLSDFISGLVPPCKVYLFPNAFQLSDAQITAIRARLEREGATAIWNYAAGYLGPAGPAAARIRQLTGINVAVSPGPAISQGLGLLQGERLGAINPETHQPMNFSPRFVVRDEAAEPLGRYRHDGAVSAAQKRVGKFRSIYIGDIGPSATALGRLFKSAGAHVWTDDGSVVVSDGDFLMIHSGKAGLKSIALPPGVQITPLEGTITRRSARAIDVNFQKGDTLWFTLTRNSQ
jgi:hypothetical protein